MMNIYIKWLSEERALVLREACDKWGVLAAIDPDEELSSVYNVDMSMDKFLIKGYADKSIAIYPKNDNLYYDHIEIEAEDFHSITLD